MLRGATDQFDVRRFLSPVDHVMPVVGLWKRPLGEWQISAVFAAPPEASPPPGFGVGHETGAQRVSLDVAQHRQEMSILLNRNRLVATLVDVTGPFGMMGPMPPLRVRQRQPVHESRQFVFHRPEHEMPVIRHDAIRQ